MFDPNQNASRTAIWFSATAFAVSILSFLAAGGQTWLMYEHNRISVMPKLDWRITYGDADAPRLAVNLVNAGLGPAKVSDIKLVFNSVTRTLSDGVACSEIDALIGADPNAKGTACFVIDADDWVFVKPNDTLTIYSSGQQDVDLDMLNQLGIQARYCSLYNQCEDL